MSTRRVKRERRKIVSTSLIRANAERLETLPQSEFYELTFFRPDDLEKVLNFLKARNARFGVHCPFIYRYAAVHPNPTSLDETLRKDTFEKNELCAGLSRKIGAEYMVLHFPNAHQKESWKKDEKIISEVLEHIATLNQLIEIRLENVYGNDDFHTPEDYIWLAKETGATLCIDVGHLLLDSEIYGIRPVDFILKCEPYISEVHLYYADIETYRRCHHAPWGNSKGFFEVLDVVKELSCDITLEAGPDCSEGLDHLLEFFESL
ncbi:sugar phosphate isomerase/epimerase family protein [Fervidobacterium thailandense]|uniref:Xylose isomerase n=1 Tax=Fervidobacterium thailandense TaxID=1008305 RepID=A0A1E3G2T1_9BACT|nr:sugar phosphate isomerase/epimerase [Fervidobacterium thailandense]ODN30519.1 xylose isomerase [Fervidobacterium thailandense]